jgi:hypothetical protein
MPGYGSFSRRKRSFETLRTSSPAWRNFAEFNVNAPLAREALFVRPRRAFAGVTAGV